MVNPTLIADKIWRGYGKAGSKLGLPHQVYRPTDGTNPIQGSRLIGTKPAIFSQDAKFVKYNKYGNALYFAYVDGTFTEQWDYLVGPEGTWFIGQQAMDLPPMAVRCNAVVTVTEPDQPEGFGVTQYGGNRVAEETPVMTTFPCSLLKSSRGENTNLLPADTRDPWWLVLLPYVDDVIIESRDFLTDANGVRYEVSLAELSEFGWRLEAIQVPT